MTEEGEIDFTQNPLIIYSDIEDKKIIESGVSKSKGYMSLEFMPKKIQNEYCKYIGDFSNGKGSRYIGTLSPRLIRESVGLNIYDTHDIYLGEWENNKRHGKGVYIFDGSSTHPQQLLFTDWNEDNKGDFGAYLVLHKHIDLNCEVKLSEESALEQFQKFKYDIYIGNFDRTGLTKGIKIKYFNHDNYYCYIGNFVGYSMCGKEGCLIQNGKKAFFGQFDSDEMQIGKVIIFKDEEEFEVEEFFDMKFIREGDKMNYECLPCDMKKEEELIEDYRNKMILYHKNSLVEDIQKSLERFFGAFDKFKVMEGYEGNEKSVEEVQDCLVLFDEKKYEDLMSILS